MPGYMMNHDPDPEPLPYNFDDWRADRDAEEGTREHDAQPPDNTPVSEEIPF